ncbi:MAG: hypothetical protein MJ162_07300 [Treponema sp.]|nr:hypothetical protein [Treponema sp.]
MAQYIKDNGEWKKIGGVEKYPADFGTRAEFDAKKDDLPVGTVFTTTDEFIEGGDGWKQIWKSPNGYTTIAYMSSSPITLSESILNYDELLIVSGRRDNATYRIPFLSEVVPTSFIKEYYFDTGYSQYGLMCGNYGSLYVYILFKDDHTFTINGDGSTGLFAIYARGKKNN